MAKIFALFLWTISVERGGSLIRSRIKIVVVSPVSLHPASPFFECVNMWLVGFGVALGGCRALIYNEGLGARAIITEADALHGGEWPSNNNGRVRN